MVKKIYGIKSRGYKTIDVDPHRKSYKQVRLIARRREAGYMGVYKLPTKLTHYKVVEVKRRRG